MHAQGAPDKEKSPSAQSCQGFRGPSGGELRGVRGPHQVYKRARAAGVPPPTVKITPARGSRLGPTTRAGAGPRGTSGSAPQGQPPVVIVRSVTITRADAAPSLDCPRASSRFCRLRVCDAEFLDRPLRWSAHGQCHRAPPVAVSRGDRSFQLGRASAPMILHFVHTVCSPNEGTVRSPGKWSTFMIASWWH